MAVESPYASTDDVGLVIAIARYNGDAFAEAYRRHAGAVFALAHRMLWERATAEEMVQEIFLRLWEQPERFDQARGSLRSFLLMDAHARCVDRLRHRSRGA
jgi:RNA polymerase sigma-70 factor (ECF subfamily)